MKKSLALFLQSAVVLFGIVVLAFLIIMPNFEGRNVQATIFEIYFKDAFLVYVYIASIPFFVALYQIFTLLGYAEKNEILLPHSFRRLRIVKYCAMMIAGSVVVAALWLLLNNTTDDKPPIILMSAIVVFICLTVISAVTVFETYSKNTKN